MRVCSRENFHVSQADPLASQPNGQTRQKQRSTTERMHTTRTNHNNIQTHYDKKKKMRCTSPIYPHNTTTLTATPPLLTNHLYRRLCQTTTSLHEKAFVLPRPSNEKAFVLPRPSNEKAFFHPRPSNEKAFVLPRPSNEKALLPRLREGVLVRSFFFQAEDGIRDRDG